VTGLVPATALVVCATVSVAMVGGWAPGYDRMRARVERAERDHPNHPATARARRWLDVNGPRMSRRWGWFLLVVTVAAAIAEVLG
jgi:hypothetical protein